MVNKLRIYLSLMLFLLFINCCNLEFIPKTDYEAMYGLTSLRLEVEPENLGELLSENYSSLYVDATLTVNTNQYQVLIRNQGGKSREFSKRNFMIKSKTMDKIFIPDFGYSLDRFVISSHWSDESMVRPLIVSEIFKDSDHLVFDLSYVTFVLNDSYQGLYFVLEPIDEFFFQRRGINIDGYFTAKYASLTHKGSYSVDIQFDRWPDLPYYPEVEELMNILDYTSGYQLEQAAPKVIDVTNFLNYIAAFIVSADVDAAHKNYTLFQVQGGKLGVVPWDFDLTFDWVDYPIKILNNLNRLLEVSNYNVFIKQRMLYLLSNTLSDSNLNAIVSYNTNKISKAYQADPYFTVYQRDLAVETMRIKNLISLRKNYLWSVLTN